MVKTTVYLPEDLKESLERAAVERGQSEAELIREAVRALVGGTEPPAPRIPLTEAGLGNPMAARQADDLLEGFGSE